MSNKRVLAMTLAALLLLLSPAAVARGGGAAAQDAAAVTNSPELQEAARLSAEVVKLHAAGKYAEALAAATRVVELREKHLGREHALVARALVNLAAVEESLRSMKEAEAHYRRAADILEKGGADSERALIEAVEGLARMESSASRAGDLHRRALALKQKVYGPESPAAARSHFYLGHLDDLLERDAEAERHFRSFVEILGKTKAAAEEDDLAVAYTRLACIALAKGKRDEADAMGARADEIFKTVLDKRRPILEGGVINGKAIRKPQPSYPAEAKRARAQGTVEVEILVGESGAVLSACAQSSDRHKLLKRASELAAYGARFTPTQVNGKPVKVRGVITYRFVLQ